MHPLLWLMLHNYRNVIVKRLRTLRSPTRLLAFLAIAGLLTIVARQREAAEEMVERTVRPETAQPAPAPTNGRKARAQPVVRTSPALLAVGRLRDDPEGVAFGIALFIAAFMSLAWLNPTRENPLELTEAENATLLPAPLRRWEVVLYKVARWQVPLLFHSLVLTLVLTGTKELDVSLRRSVSFWMLMASWRTQRGVVALVRSIPLSRGVSVASRAVVAVGVGLCLGWLWANQRPEESGDRVFAAISSLPTLAQDPTLRVLLWPVLALTRPIVLSGEGAAWLGALPAAAFVMASFIGLVVLADAIVQRTSGADRQRGQDQTRAIRTPFRLAATGHPAIALTHRQLAPFLRWSELSKPLGVIVGVSVFSWLLPYLGLRDVSLLLTGLIIALTFFFVLPLAPLFVRLDIRREMERIDVLRGLPLGPGQVLAALGAAEWIACLAVQSVAFVLFAVNMVGRGTLLKDWLYGLIFFGAFWPGATLLGVCLCQLGALTFPTWVAPSNPRGPRIDAVGGRLLTLLGFACGVGLLLLPPALAVRTVDGAFENAALGGLLALLAYYFVTLAECLLLHRWAVRSYEQLAQHDPARGQLGRGKS